MNNLRKSILLSLALSIALQAYAQESAQKLNIIERQYKNIKGDIKLLIKCFKTKKCDKDTQKALARLSAKTLALIGMIVGISAGAYMLRGRWQKKKIPPQQGQPKNKTKTLVPVKQLSPSKSGSESESNGKEEEKQLAKTDLDEIVRKALTNIKGDFEIEENFQNALKAIEQGADPDIQDAFGITLLSSFVDKKRLAEVKELIKYGANPHIKNNLGYDIVHQAFFDTPNPDIIKALLTSEKFQPNIPDSKGDTLLIKAITNLKGQDKEDIIKLLLLKGANPNKKNNNKHNAYYYAPDYRVLHLLPAQPKSSGKEEESSEKKQLIKTGSAKLDQTVQDALTNIKKNLEVEKNFQDALAAIKQGADPNIQDKQSGETLLGILVGKRLSLSMDIINPVKELLKYDADPHIKDQNNSNAMMYALSGRTSVKLIKTLLESATTTISNNINIRDDLGNTYLIKVIAQSHLSDKEKKEIIKWLIDNGANPKLENNRGKNAYSYSQYDNLRPYKQ